MERRRREGRLCGSRRNNFCGWQLRLVCSAFLVVYCPVPYRGEKSSERLLRKQTLTQKPDRSDYLHLLGFDRSCGFTWTVLGPGFGPVRIVLRTVLQAIVYLLSGLTGWFGGRPCRRTPNQPISYIATVDPTWTAASYTLLVLDDDSDRSSDLLHHRCRNRTQPLHQPACIYPAKLKRINR